MKYYKLAALGLSLVLTATVCSFTAWATPIAAQEKVSSAAFYTTPEEGRTTDPDNSSEPTPPPSSEDPAPSPSTSTPSTDPKPSTPNPPPPASSKPSPSSPPQAPSKPQDNSSKPASSSPASSKPVASKPKNPSAAPVPSTSEVSSDTESLLEPISSEESNAISLPDVDSMDLSIPQMLASGAEDTNKDSQLIGIIAWILIGVGILIVLIVLFSSKEKQFPQNRGQKTLPSQAV